MGMIPVTIQEWHKMFKESRELVEDEHHTGSPMTGRTDAQVAI